MKKTKSVIAILENGKQLFWKYGILKVTVEEICTAAGVSKMTFYRSFENKYELAKVILVEFAEENYEIFSALFSRSIPFPEIISEFLELKKQQAKAVSLEFLKDLYVQNELMNEMRSLLEASQAKLMNIVVASFEKARKDGWIKAEFNTNFILYMFENIGKMAEDENFISMFRNSEEMVTAITSFLFTGILKENKNR